MLLLPASLLGLIVQAAAERAPTAVRKLAPDANEKLFPEHLAFATLSFPEAALSARQFLDAQDARLLLEHQALQPPPPRPYRPAFARHHSHDESEQNALRRAAEALALLQRRGAACPSGMSGCDAIGQPNKCCQDGTVCTKVDDSSVGGIACCPHGSACGGRVGACPADATSCPAALGGGCCIPGYVCQGMGCVPSASATSVPPPATTSTKTVVATSTHGATQETITTTKTTWVDGAPSTVIVTEIITLTSSRAPTTKTTTETVTATGTVTGGAPWRPTGTSSDSSSSSSSSSTTEETTQQGCPTGFYGCLATHGGGCCQTDRDCQTHSCPPQASTTVVSDGRTIVVLASDVPSAAATSTCASGWFMCGSDAGAKAGCCPSGYDCGTASCFSASASHTGSVQKEQPKKAAGMANTAGFLMLLGVAVTAAACNVMI